MNWTEEINNLTEKIIIKNIENNTCYEKIYQEYKNGGLEDRRTVVYKIFKCYEEDFDAYYSIYTIMDSIEETMLMNENYSIFDAIENLEIKERY